MPENIFYQGLLEFLIYVASLDKNLSSREIDTILSFTNQKYGKNKIKSLIDDKTKFNKDIPIYISIIMLLDKFCKAEKQFIDLAIELYETVGYNMMRNNSIDETRNLNKYRNFIIGIKKYINDNYGIVSIEEAEKKIIDLVSEAKDKGMIFEFEGIKADDTFNDVVEKHSDNIQRQEDNVELKDELKQVENDEGKKETSNNKKDKLKEVSKDKTLKELLQELNSYIGLNKVKEEINALVNLVEIRNKRSAQGLKNPDMTFHLCFMGNPGTGKTTVARIVSKIYKELGILSKGHLVEVGRNDLVGGYVGQTAIKTKSVIKKAYGGVLFIDEAYSLTNKGSENDYGQEAIEVILKEMEDNRSDLVVIVAGYTNLMKDFLSSNPGLESRFNTFIDFEDYTPLELVEIVKMQCNKNDYTIDKDCEEYLKDFMANACNNKKEDFANARFARNVFENAIKKQSLRLSKLKEIKNSDLKKLQKEDF